MPLQNRVDPFGEIHAVAARGMFTGNRGVIHDPVTRTLLKRRWTTKAWIICACDFRGRRREVMGCNAPSGGAGWTELFFLDEVTALAAGHRPCFHCRRERAVDFARCFAAGQGRQTISAPDMDAALHRERWASGGLQRETGQAALLTRSKTGSKGDRKDPGRPVLAGGLPDGTMVAVSGKAYARRGGGWLEWSFDGWRDATAEIAQEKVITPPSTVAALREGYAPAWHSGI